MYKQNSLKKKEKENNCYFLLFFEAVNIYHKKDLKRKIEYFEIHMYIFN